MTENDERELDRLLNSFLASSTLDHSNDYIRRGRIYQLLDDTDAIAGWKAAFSVMAMDPGNSTARAKENDFASELQLRGISIPYKDQGALWQAWQTNARKLIEQIMADPDKMEQLQDSIATDIAKLVDDENRSRN